MVEFIKEKAGRWAFGFIMALYGKIILGWDPLAWFGHFGDRVWEFWNVYHYRMGLYLASIAFPYRQFLSFYVYSVDQRFLVNSYLSRVLQDAISCVLYA